MKVNKGAKGRNGQCKAMDKVMCTVEEAQDFSITRVTVLVGLCIK